jgi:CRISPR-associated endonuclease Cas3-HD
MDKPPFEDHMASYYAHSRHDAPPEQWEPLAAHALAVGDLAAEFAQGFGWGQAARAAGLLHDIGKASREFQAYIHGRGHSVDHSTMGARVAQNEYKEPLNRMLALCIAGHHAGLADAEALERRLNPGNQIPAAPGWKNQVTAPPFAMLRPSRPFRASKAIPEATEATPEASAFMQAFLVRMLFSCLVDADFLTTEAFMSRGSIDRGVCISLEILKTRLDAYMQTLRQNAKHSALNVVRAEILDHVTAKANEAPGFFTRTVPTGGGKTLASLSFALAHATRDRENPQRRVIYIIPFTSIIEQTAAIFRDALKLRRQHDIAVLAAFALLDPDDHALAVDRAGLEAGGFGRTAVPIRRTGRSARGKNTEKSKSFCTKDICYGRTHASTRRESLPCTKTSRRRPARPRPRHAKRTDRATRATPAGGMRPSVRNRPCRHL